MDKLERVKNAIEALGEDGSISLWNDYCTTVGSMHAYIYRNGESDIAGLAHWEFARACHYGNFSPEDGYFWLNGEGNCDSSNSPTTDTDSPFDVDDLAEWIVDNDDPLYNDVIVKALEGEDEDEDEYELTKELVARAYDAGIIKIISLDKACGESEPTEWEPVVEIGEDWFFAFGSEAEMTTVSEYLANVPKEDIIDEVYSTLLDLKHNGFTDEVDYYISFMEEQLAAKGQP